MDVPDLDSTMFKLAELADSSASNRVFAWRRILTEMWREGFDAGYMAAIRDRSVEDIITRREAQASADKPDSRSREAGAG